MIQQQTARLPNGRCCMCTSLGSERHGKAHSHEDKGAYGPLFSFWNLCALKIARLDKLLDLEFPLDVGKIDVSIVGTFYDKLDVNTGYSAWKKIVNYQVFVPRGKLTIDYGEVTDPISILLLPGI